MADSPYINWWTSDFLNAVANLRGDQIGVYTVVLNLIADQGAPIDDDPAWIGRRSGVSTRRAGMILAQLEQLGKIERRRGLIGNKRMLDEVRRRSHKSNQARTAANAKWRIWRDEHRPQLPLPEPQPTTLSQEKVPEKSEINRAKVGDKDEINAGKIPDESQKTAIPADNPQPDSRARVNPDPDSENESIEESHSSSARESESSASPLDSTRDLDRLFQRVSEVAGFVPRGAKGYAEGFEIVQRWRDDGIELESTIIPAIQRVLANSDPHDQTSSLKRFDREVRHQHAVLTAHTANGSPGPKQPSVPILLWDDEPPEALPIRNELLERIGPATYCLQAHTIRLRIEPWRSPDERILHVDVRGKWSPFWDGSNPSIMQAIARKHGLHDAWKGR